MESFKEYIEFFLQFRDTELSWTPALVTILTSTIIFSLSELYNVRKKKYKFKVENLAIKAGISAGIEFILIWLYGPRSVLVALIVGMLGSLFLKNKYFDFAKEEKFSEDELEQQSELKRLESKFSKTPNYSILEILLYYDYISPLHKETVESENIFDLPDEMANKLLNVPVITKEQLREAKAIMNVIRINGHILTKQDALLLVSKMEERRHQNEENNTSGN